jgi:hypothetical protein
MRMSGPIGGRMSTSATPPCVLGPTYAPQDRGCGECPSAILDSGGAIRGLFAIELDKSPSVQRPVRRRLHAALANEGRGLGRHMNLTNACAASRRFDTNQHDQGSSGPLELKGGGTAAEKKSRHCHRNTNHTISH